MSTTIASEEELLLTRHEAEQLLRAHDVTFTSVVRVCPEAILYLRDGTPMTAWLDRTGARLALLVQAGFAAEPASPLLVHSRQQNPYDQEYAD